MLKHGRQIISSTGEEVLPGKQRGEAAWSEDEVGEQDLLRVQASTAVCLHACSQSRQTLAAEQHACSRPSAPLPFYFLLQGRG